MAEEFIFYDHELGSRRVNGTAYTLLGEPSNRGSRVIKCIVAATITQLTELGCISSYYPGLKNQDGAGVAQVDRVKLTGTSGTANVTCGGLIKLATWNTSLTQTAADFVTAWATAYANLGITVTSSTDTLIFTAAAAGTPFTFLTGNGGYTPTIIANVTTNLAGTTSHNDVVTLTGTSGTVNITSGNLTKLATWNTTLTQTAADFVTSWAADYTAVGITVTAAVGVLTFAIALGAFLDVETSVELSLTGNLNATIVNTNNRSTPISWHNVSAAMVAGEEIMARTKFTGVKLSAGTIQCR